MKIPRKLKEILSKAGNPVVEQDKRGFAIVRPDGEKFSVEIGKISTFAQWEDLEFRVVEFAKQ